MDTSTIKYFTDRELNKFFKAIEESRLTAKTIFSKNLAVRNEAMFKIMYYCSLRATEVTLIKRDDFNEIKKEIYCKRLKHGKNNTLKIVDNDILRALKRHINKNDPNDFMFENLRDKGPLSRKTLDGLMKKYCKIACLRNTDKWHCHTLRHTRAINLAESGFDLKELQYWLGHADVTNTLIYFDFTSKQQDHLYKKLEKNTKQKTT